MLYRLWGSHILFRQRYSILPIPVHIPVSCDSVWLCAFMCTVCAWHWREEKLTKICTESYKILVGMDPSTPKARAALAFE